MTDTQIFNLLQSDSNGPPQQVNPAQEIGAEQRNPGPTRPWVYVNMVSSLDGATALDGVSGGLGGPADQQVFSALRAQADLIVAGAQTVRAENYRAPQTSEAVQAERIARGQTPRPTIVVLSGSASLEADSRLFDDPTYEPVLVTGTKADPERLRALEPKMRIVVQDNERVNLTEMLEMFADEGNQRCLVEGGPSLNGQFIIDGLVDEWNMTLSPVMASGSSNRPAHGPTAAKGDRLDLVRLWHAEGLLFGRWVRRSD